jgi:hypothetical protein
MSKLRNQAQKRRRRASAEHKRTLRNRQVVAESQRERREALVKIRDLQRRGLLDRDRTAESYLGTHRGFGDSILGKVATDLFGTARDAPGGAYALGQALSHDTAAAAGYLPGASKHARKARGEGFRTPVIARDIGRQAIEDARHPLRHPGNTLLLGAGFLSGGAALGGRVARSTSAARRATRVKPRSQKPTFRDFREQLRPRPVPRTPKEMFAPRARKARFRVTSEEHLRGWRRGSFATPSEVQRYERDMGGGLTGGIRRAPTRREAALGFGVLGGQGAGALLDRWHQHKPPAWIKSLRANKTAAERETQENAILRDETTRRRAVRPRKPAWVVAADKRSARNRATR